ncbi:SubName: Full=Uncharacterized protein {ECO:0000313/EMBL:CCA67865.1} [Serendipita indica DSM 11827]|nr:SubName: Full=Uncharacterized protein {ECO:0000313/EMBL:CCA67865.1} [Serendipita indica DSM 11827]
MDGPYFGPFNPQTFLEPPITHASMFALEQFRLCTAEGEEIGLDMIHEDNANEAADIMASGLYWEGLVLFEESDRREISRNGLRQLQRFSEEQGMPVNWEENTRILLRAEYWRHAIILDNTKPQWPVSATVFIDTRSDGDPNAAGSEIGYRRFKVKRSPRFTQLSTKSLSQAVLYHIMTYISRVKGRHVSFDQRDVSWYASWFRQLYSKDPRADFAELLRVQLESHAFVEVLVAHRRLISKGNVTLFMRRQRPVAAQSPELEDNVPRMQEEDELMDNEYGEEFDQYNRMTPGVGRYLSRRWAAISTQLQALFFAFIYSNCTHGNEELRGEQRWIFLAELTRIFLRPRRPPKAHSSRNERKQSCSSAELYMALSSVGLLYCAELEGNPAPLGPSTTRLKPNQVSSAWRFHGALRRRTAYLSYHAECTL